MSKVTTDVAALFLRLAAGAVFIPHGWSKIAGEGGSAAFAADIAANYGIPPLLGHLAAWSELAGAILLIVGLLTRLDALLLAGTMFVAAFIVQLPEALYEVPADAIKAFVAMRAIELPLAMFAICAAIVLIGPGRASLDHLLGIEERVGRWLPKKKAATEVAALV
jgi:putative oxidoreductase